MRQVRERSEGGVAFLTLDRPPGNALAPALRRELLERLHAAMSDAEIAAVVLTGGGGIFSAGVDLAEFDAPLAAPWIDDLTRAIEEAPKPVVAALDGAALGGGAELVLAAHARVARRGAKLALPEVTVGLVPGGGATQRLPRFIGAQASAEMLLTGRACAVEDPRLGPLFDRIVETPDRLLGVAAEHARALARQGRWQRARDHLGGFRDAATYQSSLAEITAGLRDRDGAEADIVACLEAAQLLPYEQGLAFEQTRFLDRLASPEARAERHFITAERRAASLPRSVAGEAREIAVAAVLGGGRRAAELASFCIARGWSTLLLGGAEGGGVAGAVRARLERAQAAGRIDGATRARRLERLRHPASPEALAEADLVLDTGEPALAAPVRLKPDVAWALVGDRVDAEARAREAGARGRTVQLRIRPETSAGGLIEAMLPPGAPPDLAATLTGAFSGAGRSVVFSAPAPGFPGDMLLAALWRAGLVMLAGGVAASDIEAGARELGFPQGVLRMIDGFGAYRALGRMRRIHKARQAPLWPLRLLSDRIADAGARPELALAFHEAEGRRLALDRQLDAWLAEWREDHPERAPPWPGEAPALALHAALINEAARMIEARAVGRASDLDLIAVRGLGFDRFRGGPLLQADLQGLLRPIRAMVRLRDVDAALWRPCGLVDDMVKNGRRFF